MRLRKYPAPNCMSMLCCNTGTPLLYVLYAMFTQTLFVIVAGYRGKNCEENIDDCPGNLCQNGATCVDLINRYDCQCPATYMGEFCEHDVDECSLRPSVCHNGATCTNTLGGFSCICVNGWAGPDCSENIDDCALAACFNGATCIDRVASFYCQCTPGKTGQYSIFNNIVYRYKFIQPY